MELLRAKDIALFFWVQKFREPWADYLMAVITEIGNTRFALGVGFLPLFFREQTRKRVGILLMVGVIVTAFAVQILKNFFQVARPFDIYYIEPVVEALGYSFPSGHAAISFVMATILSHQFPHHRIFLIGLAFAVSFSRIYLGVHFPSDCFLGALIGSGIGFIVSRSLAQKVWTDSKR